MIAECLRQLLDRKIITVKEIEEATGRGNSTIYRWLENKSHPDINDYVTLIHRIEDQRVRAALLDAITSNLPVSIHWIDDHDEANTNHIPGNFIDDAKQQTIQAMQTMLKILETLEQTNSNERLSTQACTDINESINTNISILTHIKQDLSRHAGRRRKARPLQYATSAS
ncbi:hypothetical protein JD969_05370 [Planctomycetota bacterium]|nr:hypothetical protein JD969_05370 [Planctomycetota bacterium]